jgi:hypothetical protein
MSIFPSGTGYQGVEYSKGPKVTYGDPNLFQVLLNDPQSDDDDEWGRTEEIALMMITDELDILHRDIYGPPGIGLLGNMTALLTMFVGFNPPNTGSTVFTIGGTTLQDSILSLGSGTSLAPLLFSMNGGMFTISHSIYAIGMAQLKASTGTNSSVIFTMAPDNVSPGAVIALISNNGTFEYNFSPTAFYLPSGVLLTCDSASFSSLVGGIMTGTSLTTSGNIQGQTLYALANLYVEGEDLYFYGALDGGLSTAVVHFLQYTNQSLLKVYNDATRTRWLVTGASIFDLGANIDIGSNYGVRILANDSTSKTTGIQFRGVNVGGAYEMNVQMFLGSGTVSPGTIYGLTFYNYTPGITTSIIMNKLSLYVIDSYDPPNYVSLDNVKGVSTGQNAIKWKTFTANGVTWDPTNNLMASVDVSSLGLTTSGVNIVSMEATVCKVDNTLVYTAGFNTFYINFNKSTQYVYFVFNQNAATVNNITLPINSTLSEITYNITIIVFYTQS